MTKMGITTEHFLNYSGMQVKHRKCAILHGHRVGNNWYKVDRTENIHVVIQEKEIPKIGKSGKYQYLGHDFSLDSKANQSQVNDVMGSLLHNLEKINASICYPLLPKLKRSI